MSQDMSPPLGVVHQCLDTPYNGCVYTALWGLIVHALQEVQQTAQAIQLNEPGHKPEKAGRENNKNNTKVILFIQKILNPVIPASAKAG